MNLVYTGTRTARTLYKTLQKFDGDCANGAESADGKGKLVPD